MESACIHKRLGRFDNEFPKERGIILGGVSSVCSLGCMPRTSVIVTANYKS